LLWAPGLRFYYRGIVSRCGGVVTPRQPALRSRPDPGLSRQTSANPAGDDPVENEKTLVLQEEQGLFLTFEMVEPRRLELLTS